MNHDEAVREMIEVGRRLDSLGFVPATDGNLSVRLSPREIVATVSGVGKGRLTPRDFAVIDPDGSPLRGGATVSSEILMHLRIYRERADAAAVVHAHPPTATGFAVAGIPLQQCVLPEVVATIGAVPLAPYATPSTGELPDAITPLLKEYDALLLANHGVVTFGPTLFQAANRMETVEQFARILFVARTLGQVNLLTPEQVERLNEIRHRYGFEGKAPACETCRNFASGTAPGPPPPTAATPGLPPDPARPGAPPAGASIPADLVDRVIQEVLRLLQSRAR
jgi:L-fuculose-phosphate aldolase